MSAADIREYLAQEIVVFAPQGTSLPAPDDDLLAFEFYDSLFIQEFVVSIEDHYQIRIPETDVIEENFRSTNSLTTYIEGRLS